MKSGLIVLVLGVFLMVFMIGSVSANYCFDEKENEVHFHGTIPNIVSNNLNIQSISTITVCNRNLNLIFIPTFSEYISAKSSSNHEIYLNHDLQIDYNGKYFRGYFTGFSSYRQMNNLDEYFIRIYPVLYSYDNVTWYSIEESYDKIEGYINIILYVNSSSNEIIMGNSRIEDFITVIKGNNQEQRLTALESFQQTLNNTITSFQTTITTILTTLNTLTTKVDNQETRLTALENKPIPTDNSIIPNYFKYLSQTDRKSMLCGYAEDSHLTTITDLGMNCNLTYTPYSRGERVSCKCK
ncbi:MAG TPA: hypothetical protein P5277_04440 [Candidatus Paceibacterota bacterium]|nr:hypothetical protein [Candidatus Paceibacterota bacterium]